MNIEKAGLTPAAPEIRQPVKKKAAKTAAPSDSFAQTETKPAGLMQNVSRAAKVLTMQSLDKNGKGYRMRSCITAPDGTTYIAYQSSKGPKDKEAPQNTGYISAVSPQGEILWEAPVEEEGLSHIKMGGDGSLFARTDKHLRVLNPDGTFKFDHEFEESVNGHWMDSKGSHYFITDSSHEFYKLDRQGSRVDLPEGLEGVKAYEVLQTSPNELYVRNGNDFVQLDLAAGVKKNSFTYDDPIKSTAQFSRHIDHFDIDEKGNMRLWMRNNTYVRSSHSFDDMHFGIGGMRRFGGMPHPPLDMDGGWNTTTVCAMSMERLDQNGKILWKAENLGDAPERVQLGDGSLIYTNNKPEMMDNPNYTPNAGSNNYSPRTISSGHYFIGRVGPGGKKNNEFIKVEGRIKELMLHPDNGNFIVCHGDNTLSEFNARGELQRSLCVPPEGQKLNVHGAADQDRVIFKDTWATCLHSFDMQSGTLTCLTDQEKDHSYRVRSREMEQEADLRADEVGEGIEEFDDWLNVGGVWLPRNQGEADQGKMQSEK